MLTPKEEAICGCMVLFNQLRDFKLGDSEIMEWKNTIVKLAPDATPEIIAFVIENMMIGKIEYDRNIGIKNIFLGLKEVELKDGKLRVKPQYRY